MHPDAPSHQAEMALKVKVPSWRSKVEDIHGEMFRRNPRPQRDSGHSEFQARRWALQWRNLTALLADARLLRWFAQHLGMASFKAQCGSGCHVAP